MSVKGGAEKKRDRRGYLVQAPSPVAALNVAPGHAVQDVLISSGPMCPAGQTHSVTAVAPVDDVVLPVGQLHK